MSPVNTDAMDSEEAIRFLTRQRNRNRVLAIGALVLIAVAFGIATSLMYATP